jgi:peptidoglycan/LPS O-acetylase OafA/YrhL
VTKLPLIQVLRAVAALAVALHHAQYDGVLLAKATGLAFEPLTWLPWSAGVDLFFVISGFIMVHASRDLFGRRDSVATFLARRIARIVPLYWAVSALYLMLALAAPSLLNSAILEPWPVAASFLFVPFERPDGLVQPLYSLGWTLNYEMFFYGLFALVIMQPRRKALTLLAGLLAALATLGAVADLPQPVAFWTDGIILEFAFGLLLGHMRAEGVRLGRMVRAGVAVCGLLILACDLTALGVPRFLAWGLPAACLIAAAALGEGTSVRTRSVHRATALGDASYALYLLHPFAVRGGRALVTTLGVAELFGVWGYIGVVLLASIAAALMVHRLVEKPVTDAVGRWLGAASAAPRRLAPIHPAVER